MSLIIFRKRALSLVVAAGTCCALPGDRSVQSFLMPPRSYGLTFRINHWAR